MQQYIQQHDTHLFGAISLRIIASEEWIREMKSGEARCEDPTVSTSLLVRRPQ